MEGAKKKGIKDLWEDIEVPVVILILWSVIVLFFRIDQLLPSQLIFNILSWGISLGAFGYIGYSLANKKREKEAVRAGAYAGILVGLASAVLSIISYYIFPSFFNSQIAQAVEAGADPGTIDLFMQIGLYFGLVLSPAINGAIGALISWIGSKIFKKKS